MKLEEMREKQLALDTLIEKRANLKSNDKQLIKSIIVGLSVELAEFINETKVFKHWTVKKMDKLRVLDEAADVLHLCLSLLNKMKSKGNEVNGVCEEMLKYYSTKDNKEIINNTYMYCQKHTENIYNEFEKDGKICGNLKIEVSILLIITSLISILEILGFDETDLEQAYYQKNFLNIKRQENNY